MEDFKSKKNNYLHGRNFYSFAFLKNYKEVKTRFKDDLPLLDPIEDMQIKDAGIVDIIKRIQAVEEQVVNHPLDKDPSLEQLYEKYEKKEQVRDFFK